MSTTPTAGSSGEVTAATAETDQSALDEPAPPPGPGPTPRQAVFVVGSGRSGTSTMSVILQTLGLSVPQPEVLADDTNPRGFGEPAWAVEFHHELLNRVNVQMSDGRPGAWLDAGRAATNERNRQRLFEWLEGQFAELGPELVIKDPRLVWFLGLWRSAAMRSGAESSYITMLRPVTEVVGSKQLYYSQRLGEISRTAGWVNIMLHCERATRGSRRAFVRYADLLSDWTTPVASLGERFELAAVRGASANDMRAVHNFVDPSLRRVQLTWDDIEVPTRLREIAQASWELLDRLVDPASDTPQVHGELDELRLAYADYYAACEAVTESTALATRRGGAAAERARAAAVIAAPPTTRAARIAGRVPHGVRAAIPPQARQAFHRVLGS